MESQRPHRGISMHQLAVGGNFPGLLFAIGCVLIFVISVPALGYFLAGAVATGLTIAAVLQLLDQKKKKVVCLRPDKTFGSSRLL
jgi:hypothetical protein